jgi:hypothetical protein
MAAFQLLVTANAVPSSLSVFTLKREPIRCSETSVLTRASQRDISEDYIFQEPISQGHVV